MLDKNQELAECQVRYQTLCDGQFNEGKLFKLKLGWTLRLQLSSELVHRNVRVFCNIPTERDKRFVRSTFYEYAWEHPNGSIRNDDFNLYVDVKCHLPGSFRYYFIYVDSSSGSYSFLISFFSCILTGFI